MSPVIAASKANAIVAAISGGLLTGFFHHNSGISAVPIAFAFGVFSALVAYLLVYQVARRRVAGNKPVLGAMRGAALAVATFVVATIGHTALFPGQGGFLASLLPVLLIGLAMFGWGVAIVGACMGALCERYYFA